MADARGGKPGCHFLDGILHQYWVVCGAGRLRKTVLRQPLLELQCLWLQPGLRPQRHRHALGLRRGQVD